MDNSPTNIIFFCGYGSDVPARIVESVRLHTMANASHRICAIVAGIEPQSDAGEDPLYQLAQQHSIPFVGMVRDVLKEPLYIAELFKRFEPQWAISVFCTEIFSQELIDRFEQVVNFHNGDLPAYKGVRASSWAIANGDNSAQWCVHRLTVGIDNGPVLMRGSVSIEADDTAVHLDTKMAQDFAPRVGELLSMLEQNSLGEPQKGEPNYYSYADAKRARLLGEPQNYTAQQLLHRVRAFAPVVIKLAQGNTKIRSAQIDISESQSSIEPRAGEHLIRSSDGKSLLLIE